MNRAVEEWRTVESGAQNVVYLLRGIDQEARQLLLYRLGFRREGELRGVFVARLWLHQLEVDGACIEACRCTGLHASYLKTELAQLLGQSV